MQENKAVLLVLCLWLYSRSKTAPHVLLVQSGRSNSGSDSGRISIVVVVLEGGGGRSNCRALLLKDKSKVRGDS